MFVFSTPALKKIINYSGRGKIIPEGNRYVHGRTNSTGNSKYAGKI